jgi:plasmid replication initiation protein
MSDLIIYKHNELIDNFIFNATELELQILNYAVATTNPTWENKNLVYTISIPELVALYNTKNKNIYQYYRTALARLMKRTYTYYDNDDREHIENLVTRVTRDLKDNSYLIFKFNDYISTRITNLKGFFTKYNIEHITMFKSRYAFMLYEYFKMKLEQLNHHSSSIYKHKISIDALKINLDIQGKYKAFKDLEVRVLKTAQSNINTHSDINMSYKVIRKARTPTHIVFTAKYKKPKQTKKTITTTQQTPDNELQNVAQTDDIEETNPISDSQRESGKDRIAEIKASFGSTRK